MFSTYAGELLAFGTVLCWSIGSQCFEAASKRIGSLSVNIIRLVIAFFLFCLTSLLLNGEILPWGFPAENWKWLILSGLIGFTVGDMCLFAAFVEIGPRITMLVMSLAAPIAALIGWGFLGESYVLTQWTGMAVTLGGVSWVILAQNVEKPSKNTNLHKRRVTIRGISLAFGGAAGQAVGYVMSKIGMTTESGYLDAFSSTQIRVIGGIVGFSALFFLLGWWPTVWKSLGNRIAIGYSALGAILGPFLGVALSLMALHYISSGVATTILALVPIVLIPFAIFIHKEHISIHGLLGAIVAILGITLLLG